MTTSADGALESRYILERGNVVGKVVDGEPVLGGVVDVAEDDDGAELAAEPEAEHDRRSCSRRGGRAPRSSQREKDVQRSDRDSGGEKDPATGPAVTSALQVGAEA